MLRHLLGLTLALCLLLTTSPTLACGGFFCDAISLSPIYQAGERILFSREGSWVTMHIEIVYAGDPTAFGWILPLAEVPTGPDGEEVPLDQLVQLSSKRLFTELQARTDPTFGLQRDIQDDHPCDEVLGRLLPDFANADSDDPSPTEVKVTQEAAIGPYDAQLIEATSGAMLFEWLNDQGYFQDPKSAPLLDEYVDKGFTFLGIKLQNGKATGDIKPIALTMSEQAPCVPLKLTSIAATPEMPILVWALGEGRAVPKNFIHAVVNDQALTYPGAGNYIDVVTAAVDTVEGRAWVTEYAQPASEMAGAFYNPQGLTFDSAQNATTILNVLNAVGSMGFRWDTPDVQDVLRSVIPMPEGLMGYPDGVCDWNQRPSCEPADSHLTTEDEFYPFLDYWLMRADLAEHFTETVDLDTLKSRLYEEVIQVAKRIQALFDREGLTLTRFFTTLDPDEMTRDPIFAFNPDLPNVSADRTAEIHVWFDEACHPWGTVTYGDDTQHTFDCLEIECFFPSFIPAAPDAPALKWAQILEESGLPRVFDPTQAPQVDEVLDQTTASGPTLPQHFVLDELPTEADAPVSGAPSSEDSGGCDATGKPTSALLGLTLFGALIARRRRAAWR